MLENEEYGELLESMEKVVNSHDVVIKQLLQKITDLEEYVTHNHTGAERHKAGSGKHDTDDGEQLLMRLKLLINEKRLYQRPSVPLWEIASELGISQKRLKEIIEMTGYYSLKNLFNHYRINCACQMMLAHPAFSVEAVAKESGFQSVKSFYRWFQREVGVSPTDFKLSHIAGGGK